MVFMMVVHMMVMLFSVPQDESASDIDGQADGHHRDGFRKVNRLRGDDARDGGKNHHCGYAEQEQGAGIARENFYFPGAKCKARISGIAPGCDISERAQTDGKGM